MTVRWSKCISLFFCKHWIRIHFMVHVLPKCLFFLESTWIFCSPLIATSLIPVLLLAFIFCTGSSFLPLKYSASATTSLAAFALSCCWLRVLWWLKLIMNGSLFRSWIVYHLLNHLESIRKPPLLVIAIAKKNLVVAVLLLAVAISPFTSPLFLVLT